MFDNLMNLVTGQVEKTVGGMSEIPADKRSAVVSTTASSLMSGLKQFATPDKLSGLLGMGGKSTAPAMGGLQSGVVSALTSKTGVSPAVSKSIASAVIPAVLSLLKKNVQDSSQSGFNIQSVIGGLTGAKSSAASGVMGMLGGLFGKK